MCRLAEGFYRQRLYTIIPCMFERQLRATSLQMLQDLRWKYGSCVLLLSIRPNHKSDLQRHKAQTTHLYPKWHQQVGRQDNAHPSKPDCSTWQQPRKREIQPTAYFGIGSVARWETIIAPTIIVYNVDKMANAASQLRGTRPVEEWADEFGANKVGKEKCQSDSR